MGTLFSLIASLVLDSSSCAHDERTLRCVRYERNYDGDTLTVSIPNVHPLLGEKISVRVVQIDSPEIKGRKPCEKEKARAAQLLLESHLKSAKRIDLVDVRRDKYFRILADVIVDGVSLSTLLVREGLAVPYDGGTKSAVNWCAIKPNRN